MNTTVYLALIVIFPFLASFLNAMLYIYNIKVARLNQNIFTYISITAPFISFIFSILLLLDFNGISLSQNLFVWISIDKFNVDFAFLADELSVFMTVFITFVAWLIHIYAVGYMDKDEGFGKFFVYFNMFLGFMLLLILADNPIIMFIGWEGVGLCSYLLIGFYYEDSKNVIAGNKAVFLNRIGDLGLILGIVILFFATNTSNFNFVNIENEISQADKSLLFISGILLFIGAVGKSAQFPLYVWLPDAMRGPTPISALIHAATMVTAGVYLIVRFNFIYSEFFNIGLLIAYIGAFTSFFSALIATRQNDIKKILAYSTISQLGYMFISVGIGLYSTGLFHVFTHAFFKALLFMSAGAIIVYSHHHQNIFEIAKHRVNIPIIKYSMLIGVIAICAIPPFSGFFSKDLILGGLFAKEQYLLWFVAIITAFITAFYMTRAYIVMFETNVKHEIKSTKQNHFMTFPIVILAIGSVLVGLFNVPHIFGGELQIAQWFSKLEDINEVHMSIVTEILLMVLSVGISLLGAFVSYKMYINENVYNQKEPKGIIANKFYVDEFYDKFVVKSVQKFSYFISFKIDKEIIDNFFMSMAKQYVYIGTVISRVQNGDLSMYLLYMLLSINILLLYIYFSILG